MELDINEARKYIAEKFRNAGDFDFIPDEELAAMLSSVLELDFAYLEEIGDDVYDEEVIYERMLGAVNRQFEKYKAYNMRFIDDYMDFMEQYLVSIDAIEWE